MPVLEVLRGQKLENVCCVVTRYFGGTLLGTGGLVRAYGRAAKDAVSQAGLALKQVWNKIDLILPYSFFERLRQETERFEGQILDVEYSADICLHLILPSARTEEFLARVTDLTGGKVNGLIVGEEYRAFPLKN